MCGCSTNTATTRPTSKTLPFLWSFCVGLFISRRTNIYRFCNHIIVCGGRDYSNWERIYEILDIVASKVAFTLFQGEARGADRIAKEWAIENNNPYRGFKPDWDRYGDSAGGLRNKDMLDEGATHVIAFDGGTGTANMIRQARERGIPVWIIQDE